MGHFLSVLSPSESCVSLPAIQRRVHDEALDVTLEVTEGDSQSWLHVEVSGAPDRRPVLDVYRPVVQRNLADDHLASHLASIAGAKPDSAVMWLTEYLKRVRAIYTLEVLDARPEGDGEDWEVVWAIQSAILESTGGILQADGEGYSNDAGDHILWQFDEGASGTWRMAVLDELERWQRFEMELSDPAARDAFLGGRVPESARRL